MDMIMEILSPSMQMAVAALVSLVAGIVAAKLGFKVPAPLQVKAVELIVQGAIKAEASLRGMTSETKVQAALAAADRMAADNPKLRKIIVKSGRGLLESALRSKLTPDEMTPKDPAKAQAGGK